MALHALVYVSRAAPGLTVDQIDDLAQDAALHNRIAGVTGVLLSDGRRFLQYLEGPEEGLDLSYARVLNATSHVDIVELGRSRGGIRRFPYWSMRWIPVEGDELKGVLRNDWQGTHFSQAPGALLFPAGIERIHALVQPHVN